MPAGHDDGSVAPAPEGAHARPPVSAYIRTLNEARMIEDVVRAALAVAAEVVVVDSGSRDGTIERAAAAGARVHHQDWLGNGGQKRAAEDLCRHDWLLDLDADEVVSPELAREIALLFAGGEPALPIYEIPLVTAPPYGPPWRGVDVSRRGKLYDRRVARMPDHKAWDQLEPPPGARVGALNAPILHHSFTGIEHLVDKVNRNTTNRARESRLKPRAWVVARVYFGLPIYFLRRYVLHGLFLRGTYGFAFAMTVAIGRWLRDVKMYERHLAADETGRADRGDAPAASNAEGSP
jgi:glycosyltransferase involved in cell wall biosynthesis